MLKRHFQNDLEFCQQRDIGVTPYQVLQGGLLSGKYKRGQEAPAGSRMAEKPAWLGQPDPSVYDLLEATEELAAEVDLDLAQYALAWTLAQPAMTSLVVGATRIEQIASAVKAAEVDLPGSVLERQDTITPPPHRHGPGFARS
jgi:aryl-alcohol dehydrogenase-like predicted oxidoreductase